MKKNRLVFILSFLFLFSMCLFVSLSACKKKPEPAAYTSYIVTFKSGDESLTKNSDTMTGKVAALQDFLRAGYTFSGWYTSEEFIEEFDFNEIITADIVLYAKWTKNLNKIHFEGNGNTNGIMEDAEAETDSVIKLPLNIYKKTGYTFIGWSDSPTGSIKNTDGGWFYMDNLSAVTLFASWQANSYTVTLDAQSGVSESLKVTAVYGAYLEKSAKPTKAGFVLEGYFSQTEGNGLKYYDSEMNGVLAYREINDLTLYAYWLPAENALSFNGNGQDGGTMEIIETATFETVILPDCKFIRTGYYFKGWNTSADGSGELYHAEDEFIMQASNERIILYADWAPNKYYIVYDDNNGGARIFIEHTYDEEQKISANIFLKTGYIFVCWSASENEAGIFYQNQIVKNLCDENEGQFVLHAIWTPVTVTVIFNKLGGESGTNSVKVTYDSNFPLAVAPVKAGYIFGGYYALSGGQDKEYLDSNMNPVSVSDIAENNTEVFAYWISKANTIVFDSNGGIGEQQSKNTFTDESVILPGSDFTKAGYTFNAWNTKVDGSGDKYFAGDQFVTPPSNTAIKLYAVWAPKPIVVVFNGNEHTSGETKSINGVSDGSVILPECGYFKTGYTFIGWSTTQIGENIFPAQGTFVLQATDNGTTTIFARWELVRYTIKYNLNGGTNSQNNPNGYTYLSGNIVLANPSRLGFNFIGWVEGSNIPAGSTGDKEFTANWLIITYTIIYILNGGTNNAANPSTYTVESPTIILNNPTKNGSTFEGWSEGNCIETGSIGGRTFTAEWNGITYRITYMLDGGQNGAGNPGSYTIDSPTITLTSPTKRGYTFMGWSPNDTIPSGSREDKTFTALWQIQIFTITYVLNGGRNSEDNLLTYTVEDDTIFICAAVKIGYDFGGWQEGILIESGSIGNRTFTAQWFIITYNIFYIMDDGEIDPSNPETYNIESEEIVILNNVFKEGYNFIGWVEGENEPTLFLTIKAGSTGSKVFVAIWEAIEYDIFYDLDDGENNEDNPAKYTIEDIIVLANPTKESFIFGGWEDEEGCAVTKIPRGSTGNITLIAKWIPEIF